MAVRTDAARLLVLNGARFKDEGRMFTKEAAIAKLYASEAAQASASAAIQVHGGYGYLNDFPVERYFRDARAASLYEGTSQIQKLVIGRLLTGESAFE